MKIMFMYEILLPLGSSERNAEASVEMIDNLPRHTDEILVRILNVHREVDVIDDSVYRSSDDFDETKFPESVLLAERLLESAGVRVEKQRKHGDPVEEVLSVADDMEANLIVITAAKQTPTGKVLFGSIAQAVLLASDQPVLISVLPE